MLFPNLMKFFILLPQLTWVFFGNHLIFRRFNTRCGLVKALMFLKDIDLEQFPQKYNLFFPHPDFFFNFTFSYNSIFPLSLYSSNSNLYGLSWPSCQTSQNALTKGPHFEQVNILCLERFVISSSNDFVEKFHYLPLLLQRACQKWKNRCLRGGRGIERLI